MTRIQRSRAEKQEEAIRLKYERRRRQIERKERKKQTSVKGQKAKEGPSSLQIVLPEDRLEGLLPNELSYISCEIFKLLLYMRGQLPDTYERLLQGRQEKDFSLSSSSKRGQRITKFDTLSTKLEKVFSFLEQPHFFKVGLHYDVLFIFGNTIRRPKEAYILRAKTADDSHFGAPINTDKKSSLCQRINRKIVMKLMQSDRSDVLKPCKIHVLLRSHSDLGEFPGFLPNNTFDLERVKIQPMQVELCGGSVPKLTEAVSREYWHQCTISITGVKI